MSHSVSYNFQPGDEVYVINKLGPNGQYPYWGLPFVGGGYGYNPGMTGYPNGFTSMTPAIMAGQVLQTRILMSTNSQTPIIMYDVRVSSQMGSVSFPEDVVYPATAGTAGNQTVNFNGSLTFSTPISLSSASYSSTIYVDGVPNTVTIDLSTVTTIAALISTFNYQVSDALMSLVNGNLVVTSSSVGAQSSIVIVDALTNPLFASLPGYVGLQTAAPGTASGLDQATAAYEALVK